MKFLVTFALAVACVHADVAHLRNSEVDAQVLRSDADVQPDRYSYVYETSNGISGQESGVLKNVGKDEAALEVKGSNQYTSPEGQQIQITYTADENGYQPQGSHLPTPPPPQAIPDYILRSLEYIAAHPPRPEN
ncbi:larval cuticle protein LCP-17-like [Cydia pomonella]|uniref:larval cuticle protein LCP-17-like n=1 Tax=Cydia pomonella TaxID=82600 RepID=UPI002ADE3F3E|nr:larval cuticle protein LCP-17-like [Cydia pomonella]